MKARSIHISDVLTFKTCRRAWDWSSELRSNLQPVATYVPFFVGSAVHYCMERLYMVGTPPSAALFAYCQDYRAYLDSIDSELWERARPILQPEIDRVEGIMQHYLVWANGEHGPFSDGMFDFISAEQSFDVPLRNPSGKRSSRVRLAGRFDGVVRHKLDGKLYLWEIKTTRSIQERIKQLAHDEQASAYALAASEALGEPVEGIIYTIIRKRVPDVPGVLKDGMLSKAKITTTSAIYAQAIRDHHGASATVDWVNQHYGAMLTQLAIEDHGKFFMRVTVRRSAAELARTNRELLAVGLEMLSPQVSTYRHGGMHCSYCRFREPCMALESGLDHQSMLASQYRPNDRRHVVIRDEDQDSANT